MLFITILSIVFGAVAFAKESFRLLMYFMREGGTLIDKATPMAQVVFNFFEKIVGGFYLLLAMVYRDARTSHPQPAQDPQLGLGGPGYSPTQPALMPDGHPTSTPNRSGYTPNATRRYVSQNSWNLGNDSQY